MEFQHLLKWVLGGKVPFDANTDWLHQYVNVHKVFDNLTVSEFSSLYAQFGKQPVIAIFGCEDCGV